MLPRRRARQKNLFNCLGILPEFMQFVSLIVHPQAFKRHLLTPFRMTTCAFCCLGWSKAESPEPGGGRSGAKTIWSSPVTRERGSLWHKKCEIDTSRRRGG
jgi:hypothetical protein